MFFRSYAVYKYGKQLVEDIRACYNTLRQDNNLDAFKAQCQNAIHKARPELEQHRGWKLTLSYLMITLMTGIGLLVALTDVAHKAYTGKHFSFFQTDTAQKMSNLEKAMEKISGPQKTQ